MQDMRIIAETFRVMSGCVDMGRWGPDETWERRSSMSLLHNHLIDPHKDADEWLAASPQEKERLRPVFEAKRLAVAKENARTIVTREQRLEIKRRASRAWMLRNLPLYKARQKAWRDSHREYMAAKGRERRAGLRANPEAYRTEREKERVRLKLRRARLRGNKPPRKTRTPEERKVDKRNWNRAYQRTHPRVYTTEQIARRNERQKLYYRAQDKAKKLAKLAKKRAAWPTRSKEQKLKRQQHLAAHRERVKDNPEFLELKREKDRMRARKRRAKS